MTRIGEDIDTSIHAAADWLLRRGHATPAADILRQNQMQSRLFREQVSLVYPTGIEHICRPGTMPSQPSERAAA